LDARILSPMPATPLQRLLAHYRVTSQTEREKGTYFEERIRTYLRYEASYADLSIAFQSPTRFLKAA